MKRLLALLLLLLVANPVQAQQQHGMTVCNANTLAVTGASSNVQLSNCGPNVIVYNIGTTEVFYNAGVGSSLAATAGSTAPGSYSLAGNSFIVLTVPNLINPPWFFAAITAAGTSTIRLVQGTNQ